MPYYRQPGWFTNNVFNRVVAVMTRLGLSAKVAKRPSQLSGGERQRVSIARALANDPLVVLADEPTGNLDSVAAANVRDVFRELAHDMGKTVVAVTHDPAFAGAADRRIGWVDGRLASST